MRRPLASISIATYNHDSLLLNTLESIFKQSESELCQVVVVDDGSIDGTKEVCSEFPSVEYIYNKRKPGHHNQNIARNISLRACKSDVVIMQSDDVVHEGFDVIRKLIDKLRYDNFVIAKVYDPIEGWVYTGTENPRPFFFLGSIMRENLVEIDEEFDEPAYEDDWFARCLIYGQKLWPAFWDDVVGRHQHHERPPFNFPRMEALYNKKCEEGIFPKPWGAS